LSFHPRLVDGVVLSACPCDVRPWRIHRARTQFFGRVWPNSLSPIDHVPLVSADAVVVAVTGAQDGNTAPKYAQDYVAALRAAGVANAEFVLARDATHAAMLDSEELREAVQRVVDRLRSRRMEGRTGPPASALPGS
jgi:hypothetical protein